MATNKLNDNKIKRMIRNPPERDQWVSDGQGLSCKLTKGGTLAWYFRYRLGAGAPRKINFPLGVTPGCPWLPPASCVSSAGSGWPTMKTRASSSMLKHRKR